MLFQFVKGSLYEFKVTVKILYSSIFLTINFNIFNIFYFTTTYVVLLHPQLHLLILSHGMLVDMIAGL